jgi:hypothetical protein
VVEITPEALLQTVGDYATLANGADAGTWTAPLPRGREAFEGAQTLSYFSIRHSSVSPSAIQAFQAGNAIIAFI